MFHIIVAVIVTVAFQLVGHYFKWELFTGSQQLGRMGSYTWGVGAILLGMIIWAASLCEQAIQPFEAVLALAILAAASGLIVGAAYTLDHIGSELHYNRTRKTMDRVASSDGGQQ